MNKFLNDNWEEVLKDLGGAISKTFEQILTSIFKGYMESVPFDEILLP